MMCKTPDPWDLGFTRSQELELASRVYYLPLSFASRATAGKRRGVRDRRLDLGWKVWGSCRDRCLAPTAHPGPQESPSLEASQNT